MKKSSLAAALALLGATAHANVERIDPVPTAAAAVIDEVHAAIDAHDLAALERLTAPRFRATWKARSDELDGLVGFLADCHGRGARRVVCGSGSSAIIGTDGPPARQVSLFFERVGKRWMWTDWTP